MTIRTSVADSERKRITYWVSSRESFAVDTISKHEPAITPFYRKVTAQSSIWYHSDLLYQQEPTEQFPRRKNNCPLHCKPELSEQHVSAKYVSRKDDSNSSSPSLGESVIKTTKFIKMSVTY